MKNIEYQKQNICNRIMDFTYEEMYELMTGDNPFRGPICIHCESVFGVCSDELKSDELCKKRFIKWCNMLK